jgi:hypothetical protein
MDLDPRNRIGRHPQSGESLEDQKILSFNVSCLVDKMLGHDQMRQTVWEIDER